jgi:ATP-dependent Lon protease
MSSINNDNSSEEKNASAADGGPEVNSMDSPAIPSELALLPLRGVVVYPLMVLPLTIGQPRSIRLVDEAVLGQRIIGLVASRDPELEDPAPDEIYRTGTAAIIHRLIKAPDGTMRIIVQGVERIRITDYTQKEPYFKAQIEVAPEKVEQSMEMEALMRNAVDLFRRLVELVPHLPDELMTAAFNAESPRQLVYLIATSIRIGLSDAQEILELDSVADKLRKLNHILNREVEVLELGKKIQSEAQSEMEKVQREYFLREQLKAIQRELGEQDEQAMEVEELRQKIADAGMPEEAEKEARRELDRLAKLPTAAAEYGVIRTYLDWMTSLPWAKSTGDILDISHARQVLDEDHYDLREIKERILEYLAVRKLRKEREGERPAEPADYIRREREGVILCFVGPPGVGKTSLGQSIARSLGRKFVRMSLGGVRDEAEIRGFRRTYIGSMPGRIIQALRRIETKNPVFMLDEVDKLGYDFRGDPASALLEVLDPEQNCDFRDHYLDVPFDLSQVMFITTANLLDPIPGPLRDRMEILQLSGYTEGEKVQIAQQYLIPRQVRENSLRSDEVSFSDEALRLIIREYTREAGVRNLEREIGSVCRKVVTKIAEGQSLSIKVEAEEIAEYLGKPRYFFEAAERTEMPGVATGLSVTATGGDILFIEATKMPGKQGFTTTGQLGDVMRESAQAALSYVRSKARELDIEEDFFSHSDIHLHVPAGAIPKDGPSAGVTMATALASLLTGRPVRSNVGMTGEITLRGQVLPVGGIKEKVLAAHRAGLQTVILPRRNEKDLDDLPPDIRQEMRFILVDFVGEVLAAALSDGKPGTDNLTPVSAQPPVEDVHRPQADGED